MPRTILVTGGAGFIGSHLVARLVKSNNVTVLDNLSSGRKSNLNGMKLKFTCGDIRQTRLVDRLVRQSDMVFHLAEYIPETTLYGVGHVIRYSVNKPLQDFDVGCKGTLNLLEMCRKHDKPIVFSSTAAVYGNGYINPIKEDAPTIPVSPYGASKLCAETYIALYSRLYGLQTDILRFFNVYGPKQRKYLIFDLLLKLRSDPTRLEVKGTGEERRDFIYVADAVDSLLIVTSKRERGIICNVGTGGSYSVSQVVNLTIRSLGLKPAITYTGASWKGDINCLVADNERLLGFGFAPKWSLKQGIRETIRWFAEYSKTKPD